MTTIKPLYIGVCKENLDRYFPSHIKGEFLNKQFTETELQTIIIAKKINVLMVDVLHIPFTKSLLQKLQGRIKIINFLYQSIESLIDIQEAEICDIQIRKLPDDIYCNEVAEFAVTQLLSACKGTIEFNKSIKEGKWDQGIRTNFSLRGKTLGIVGFGNIGKAIVKLCQSWGMNILVTRKHGNKDTDISNVTFVNFSDLIEQSHYIILAIPINRDTFHMLNEKYIKKLRKNSIIVNISRGDIVDESAIAESLISGRLYKYCTDVFSQEPVPKDHILVRNPHTILSPHVAWATEDTMQKAYRLWFKEL